MYLVVKCLCEFVSAINGFHDVIYLVIGTRIIVLKTI
jgi:hypothetical protein